MKSLIKLFAAIAAVIFALVAVIKIVQKCSWKDAVGILEELYGEIRENCCSCCGTNTKSECSEAAEAPEESEEA